MIVRLCPIVCVSVNVRCMIDGHASHKGNPWPMGVHGFITIPFHGKTTHVWPWHTCSLQSYVPIQNIDCPILHVHVLIWSHLRISSHILMFLDHDWFFLYLLILSQENHQKSTRPSSPMSQSALTFELTSEGGPCHLQSCCTSHGSHGSQRSVPQSRHRRSKVGSTRDWSWSPKM